MTTATVSPTSVTAANRLDFGNAKIHRNLPVPNLIEIAIKRGEGVLAANGALMCDTGERTGRSPGDKFLEDTPGVHNNIGWGKVNQPITSVNFAKLEKLARNHLSKKSELFQFDGFAGADP